MSTPLIVIVGADKGGVGKTTISRALLDYFKTKGREFRAFDTEAPEGTLHRFYPSNSTIVDLTKSDDQMKVFDNLTDNAVTVIDVRAGLLTPTLQTLTDIGFLDMARQGKIRIVVLHIVGSTIASLNEIAGTSKLMADAQHFVVKNHTNGSAFFDGINDVAKGLFNNDTLEVPKLDERAAEYVEASAQPFGTFVDDANQSQVLRGKVRYWLAQVFPQFDRAKLD